MRKTEPTKNDLETKQYFFDPKKETKKEREARLNAMVKRALENIIPNAGNAKR